MDFDFSAMAKRARAQISAPEVPMNFIVARSREARRRGRVRALVICGALSVATIGTAAAFGTSIYDGVRLWISGNRAAVVISSFAMVSEPTANDLRSAMAHATFSVALPIGLPAGTRIVRMWYAPAARPNILGLDYQNARTKLRSGIALFDSTAVNSGDAVLPTGSLRPPFQESYRWQLGRETVLVLKRTISLPDVVRIKAAMMTVGPTASLAATEPMLSKARILGLAPNLPQIAAHYAPSSGHTVVVGPQMLRSIPDLAKRGDPMLDTRTVYFSNIPSLHGEPDYSRATLHWPRIIAISAAGVRAIDAVFRFTRSGNNCNCAMLFNESNGKPYEVLAFAKSSFTAVKKYSVDTKTFAVTTQRPGDP